MTVYVSLVLLTLGLLTLVFGNYSDRQRRAIHFGVGVTFVALAAIVMMVSAIRSLWLYPLS
jgi:sugar phosphate permease